MAVLASLWSSVCAPVNAAVRDRLCFGFAQLISRHRLYRDGLLQQAQSCNPSSSTHLQICEVAVSGAYLRHSLEIGRLLQSMDAPLPVELTRCGQGISCHQRLSRTVADLITSNNCIATNLTKSLLRRARFLNHHLRTGYILMHIATTSSN